MLPLLYNHLDSMMWRYSTQAYDPTRKIDKESLYALLEILRLSPTTQGLQLWRAVLVETAEVRKQLIPHCQALSSGHPEHHIQSASHLLLLCRPQHFEAAYIDQYIEHLAYVRHKSISELHSLSHKLHEWAKRKAEQMESWMDQQAYFALGNFLAACAAARIDSCLIENFSREEFSAILNLKGKNLSPVVGCSIGYRSPQDSTQKEKKVRYPIEDLLIYR